MSIKDEVEKKFRESIDNHPDQDFIKSLGPVEIEYVYEDSKVDFGKVEYVRGRFPERGFYFAGKINASEFIRDSELASLHQESTILSFVGEIKEKINKDNKKLILYLLEETIKAMPDQNLIKTYGMYYDNGETTFIAEIPNHEKGLFFAGGVYPNFWGYEMNTINFINSLEYRKTFCNNVILAIMGHCEENGIC